MKHKIGSVNGTYKLIERIDKNTVKARCINCGAEPKVMSLALFCTAPKACSECKVVHNKKYVVGSKIHNWELIECIKGDIFYAKCGGPKCGGSIHKRQAKGLIYSKGCRKCFGIGVISPEGKEKQRKAREDANLKKQQQVREKYIGKTYNHLKIIGVDMCYVICECTGKGPHDPSNNKFVRHDVVSGKTTSCGCMHSDMLKSTMQKRYGVNSMMDMEGHRDRLIEGYKRSKKDGSVPEKEMMDFIKNTLGVSDAKKWWFKVKKEHRLPGARQNSFEVDIYSEPMKLAVEHNGLYRHTFEEYVKRYHKEDNPEKAAKYFHQWKTEMAKKMFGVRIIHIWGHEWLTKNKQVKSFLRSAFGKNENKIGARECESRIITRDEACPFFNEYHLQGEINGFLYVGLFYQGELLAVASFGYHHRKTDTPTAVLQRWCGKENWTIQGGLSKIVSFAKPILLEKGFKEIITWADLRLSEGAGYLSSGWKYKKKWTPPDYFYYNHSEKEVIEKDVIPKQNRKKRTVGTPNDMTEFEHAELDGLRRIYDCGKSTFSYDLTS